MPPRASPSSTCVQRRYRMPRSESSTAASRQRKERHRPHPLRHCPKEGGDEKYDEKYDEKTSCTPTVLPSVQAWYVYICKCYRRKNSKRFSYYTGITTDKRRRERTHQGELKRKDHKYTRAHERVDMVWSAPCTMDRSNASKLEYRIKRLSRGRKHELVTLAPEDAKCILVWQTLMNGLVCLPYP